MESKKLELIVFSGLFVVLSVLTFFVFQPFLRVIVLAAVLSVLVHPLYVKMVAMFRGHRSVAAALLVIMAFVFLIAPVLFFGLQILGQAQNFFYWTHADQGQYIQLAQQSIDVFIQHFVPGFSFNLADSISRLLAFVSSNLGGLISQTTFIFFETFFVLVTFFFFLRDGEKMLDSVVSLSPFEKAQNKEMISSVNRTITSVVRGTIFVGLIRFGLLAAAFYLLGIPNALLWGSIAGIIGAIPGLGTPFAVIPAFVYLLLYGNIFSVIGMGLFGVLLFFFVDNMLATYFLGKGLDVPALFILFAILGGVIFWGPLGLIFGPIVLSLFISMIDIYKILVLNKQ
jgi:predicted PurR-regulated permease PerM